MSGDGSLGAALHPNRSKKTDAVAAVFDLDYTLIPRTSLERMFIRRLWERGDLKAGDLYRFMIAVLLREQGPLSQRIKTNKEYLAGKSIEETAGLAESFYQEVVRKVLSKKALAALEDHRQTGRRLILLTGCPDFLVLPLSKSLGIDSVIAARLEVEEGRLTGRLIPPHPYGEAKRLLLLSWARENRVYLEDSFAYADSPADLSVLCSVGYPRAVNPGARMRRIAMDRGWPVLAW